MKPLPLLPVALVLYVLGNLFPADFAWTLVVKALAELGAFAVVCWTLSWLIRKGIPNMADGYREESRQVREHTERVVSGIVREHEADRVQRGEEHRQTIDTLQGLTEAIARGEPAAIKQNTPTRSEL